MNSAAFGLESISSVSTWLGICIYIYAYVYIATCLFHECHFYTSTKNNALYVQYIYIAKQNKQSKGPQRTTHLHDLCKRLLVFPLFPFLLLLRNEFFRTVVHLFVHGCSLCYRELDITYVNICTYSSSMITGIQHT